MSEVSGVAFAFFFFPYLFGRGNKRYFLRSEGFIQIRLSVFYVSTISKAIEFAAPFYSKSELCFFLSIVLHES